MNIKLKDLPTIKELFLTREVVVKNSKRAESKKIGANVINDPMHVDRAEMLNYIHWCLRNESKWHKFRAAIGAVLTWFAIRAVWVIKNIRHD